MFLRVTNGRHILLIPILFAILSCSSPSQETNEQPSAATAHNWDSSFQKGVLMARIKCKSDTSLTYALYLPKRYTSFERSPVIFLFDPHGDGSLPIEKYKELAEKYGYILAGSNTSKNGMSWEQNNAQIKVFMQDALGDRKSTRLNSSH